MEMWMLWMGIGVCWLGFLATWMKILDLDVELAKHDQRREELAAGFTRRIRCLEADVAVLRRSVDQRRKADALDDLDPKIGGTW